MGHGAFPHANLGRIYLPLESGCLNPAPRSDEVVKLKEENLMYSAMREKEVKEQKAHAALSKILILVGGSRCYRLL